tara:strand:+ start:417 stop:683 length:267 start_codon:yes stop_codon:yes gene_type:complete
MDSKKIASYVTLILGLIIIAMVFFEKYRGFGFTTDIRYTEFRHKARYDLGFRGREEILWWVLLISFSISWWGLREKISKLLLKFHKVL